MKKKDQEAIAKLYMESHNDEHNLDFHDRYITLKPGSEYLNKPFKIDGSDKVYQFLWKTWPHGTSGPIVQTVGIEYGSKGYASFLIANGLRKIDDNKFEANMPGYDVHDKPIFGEWV